MDDHTPKEWRNALIKIGENKLTQFTKECWNLGALEVKNAKTKAIIVEKQEGVYIREDDIRSTSKHWNHVCNDCGRRFPHKHCVNFHVRHCMHKDVTKVGGMKIRMAACQALR